MPTRDRDPYAAPDAPKSKSGPLVRYAILAGLLAAAGAGYATMTSAPGPAETAAIEAPTAAEPATFADASQDPGYAAAAVEPAPPPRPEPAPAPRASPPRETAPPPVEPALEPTPEPTPPPLSAPAPAATPLPPDA